jgi:hypothetical protein
VTIALSGVLSAFLVNDVVCVALTPLVLHLCQRLKRPPILYLVVLATASNVGSVATITGNPQNIIIFFLADVRYDQIKRAAPFKRAEVSRLGGATLRKTGYSTRLWPDGCDALRNSSVLRYNGRCHGSRLWLCWIITP